MCRRKRLFLLQGSPKGDSGAPDRQQRRWQGSAGLQCRPRGAGCGLRSRPGTGAARKPEPGEPTGGEGRWRAGDIWWTFGDMWSSPSQAESRGSKRKKPLQKEAERWNDFVVQRVPITARGRRLTPVTGGKLECGGGEHKPWVCHSVRVCVRASVCLGVAVCVKHAVLWNDSCRGVELLS